MSELPTQTILVTGAAGGLGRFVLEEVLSRGHRAVAFSRSVTRTFTPAPNLIPVDGSVEDSAEVRSVLRENGVTRIIHVAADLSGGRSTTPNSWRRDGFDPWSVAHAARTNVLGAVNLCAAAVELGIQRFVLMSSKGVYGDMPRTTPAPPYLLEDELPLRPVSAYGVTKWMAEIAVEHFADHYGLDAVIIRGGTTIGPETTTRVRRGVTNAILSGVISGNDVTIAEGGDAVDDFVYLGDLGRGLVDLCLSGPLPRRIYHLSAGVPLRLQDLADAARPLAPGEPKVTIGGGDDFLHLNHNNHAILSSDRLASDLGFRARVPREWIEDFACAQGLLESAPMKGTT